MKLKRIFAGVPFAGALAFIALLQWTDVAHADPPIWAVTKGVKAIYTQCGKLYYITLQGPGAKLPERSGSSDCTSLQQEYQYAHVSKSFFPAGGKGPVAAWRVNAGMLDCGEGKRALILGGPGETEGLRRQLGPMTDCKYVRRQFEYVSSMGSITFNDVANGGTMSVAESLAMHAKEREQAIAECNANPLCRAQVDRMRSSGSGAAGQPCISETYSTYNGAGRCVDGNGMADPKGTLVSPP
ncbi:MAG: hypothetical protein SH859_08835 [Hyphomicrobium aestuarii]|nr:hypothetical protein [Hyphomicrobium aestuarii]